MQLPLLHSSEYILLPRNEENQLNFNNVTDEQKVTLTSIIDWNEEIVEKETQCLVGSLRFYIYGLTVELRLKDNPGLC